MVLILLPSTRITLGGILSRTSPPGTRFVIILFVLLSTVGIFAFAQMDHSKMNHASMDHRTHWGPSSCKDDEAWDNSQAMCLPINVNGQERHDLMVHGNAFATGIWAEKPRGKDQFAIPNMLMTNMGTSIHQNQYLNLNLMLTFEKWTFSKNGYSELLQIGERDEDENPYIDAQHPHSSPIMGLTITDTFYLGEGKDNFRLFFAPRGQATDGPIAFMHRPTGMANPDAPLGHHLAQDAGHITSTVLGASLAKNKTTIEISAFHGEEPEPTKVDLPIGDLDSYGLRISHELNNNWLVMASTAFVKNPEGDHDPNIDHNWRYSISSYNQTMVGDDGWTFSNSLIYGVINFLDGVTKLESLNEEFLFYKNPFNIWGRFEYVQRTPAQLGILTTSDGLAPQDVYALTLGYTHDLSSWQSIKFGVGGSATKVMLPNELEEAYNSDPVSGRLFIQLTGMWMSM